MTQEFLTGQVIGLDQEKLTDAFDTLNRYYKQTLEPLIYTMEQNYPGRDSDDTKLSSIKHGNALKRFMDDVPNFVAGVSLAAGEEGDAQSIYQAMISPLKTQLKNGFPEDHFAQARTMIAAYPDKEKAMVATLALQHYESQLRGITMYLNSFFQPELKPAAEMPTTSVSSIDAAAGIAPGISGARR